MAHGVRHPAVQQPAPLRQLVWRRVPGDGRASPGCSAAGSSPAGSARSTSSGAARVTRLFSSRLIAAACSTPARRRCRPWSPGCSAAGSIAASRHRPGRGLAARRVTRLFSSRPHCGGNDRSDRAQIMVTRLFSSRLHCGRRLWWTSRPIRHGLAHPGHPAHQQPAPLRPASGSRLRRWRRRVTPPISGGLHCGSHRLSVLGETYRFTPPISGGSIAAALR